LKKEKDKRHSAERSAKEAS